MGDGGAGGPDRADAGVARGLGRRRDRVHRDAEPLQRGPRRRGGVLGAGAVEAAIRDDDERRRPLVGGAGERLERGAEVRAALRPASRGRRGRAGAAGAAAPASARGVDAGAGPTPSPACASAGSGAPSPNR
ncbi:hypothetical protein SCE1572_33410 [Sorangium cellulosum So0157-2]|uniref:Uncharacterized protein n=1 Tax=Sorangium cellulosum So0157-2 TaxID=1254432 RepID=S4Y2G3_SORCE|nr:hypothetical protein SCE1572_33410 [Sorangium cellulosum So0157-2]